MTASKISGLAAGGAVLSTDQFAAARAGANKSILGSDLVPIYLDYSGSLAWTGATSNPAIGNGTIIARYAQVGKHVHYYGEIDFGSTTTYGSGAWRISTPVLAKTEIYIVGAGEVASSINNGTLVTVAIGGSNAYMSLVYYATYLGARTDVDATHPFTAASGGYIVWNALYEAA